MAAPQEEVWLPLLDYSVRTGVSMSTLRRHIKSQRIRFKIDDGKYWVPFASGTSNPDQQKFMALPTVVAAPNEIARLRVDLKNAREEIAELKTLIAFYEESLGARE